jgi:hypothetical protein
MIAVLGIGSMIVIKQHLRIGRLRESRRHLAAQYQELSATNTSLLSGDAALNDELIRLQQQNLELLRLRSQLAEARQQLAAADAEPSRTANTNELAGYLTKGQLRFVGFNTPENAFQSLNWAAANGGYTNWLACLSPGAQEEELQNSKSLEEFQRGLINKITGMQVLATKAIGSDRVELKVRLDSESAVNVLIFPMVVIGSEWKFGGDINSYTQAWDSPDGAQ